MIKKIFAFGLCLCWVFMMSNPAYAQSITSGAKAACVVNGETGEIIYSVNGNVRLPMASTTKIMTAILLIENCQLGEKIVTTREMVTVEGSSMGLLEGDTVSFEALLYGMMLPSGNDAATTTAIAIGGTLQNFALMMNKKAAEIGMNNTNFVTPSGLDAENHYSTAEDMAKLAVYAMKNPIFKEVVATKRKTLYYGNPPYRRTVYGHNKILDIYSGGNGVKTGYTSKSGKCLVSSAERNGCKVISVTLNDSATWNNHSILLDYGFSRLHSVNLELPKEYCKPQVISGQKDNVSLETLKSEVFLTADEIENIRYKINLIPFLYAPLKKGDKVGEIQYYIGETHLKTLDITVKRDVKLKEKKPLPFYMEFINNIKLLMEI